MEGLPLGRIAALVPEFAVNDLPLDRTHDDDDVKEYSDLITQGYFQKNYKNSDTFGKVMYLLLQEFANKHV